MMLLASDLCKPSRVPFESNTEHHDWVTNWRNELCLTNLSSWDMEENVKRCQSEMLHATWKINAALEALGKATFAVCPIRRHLVPRFVHFDTKAIAAVLGTGLTEHQKYMNRIAETKRKERAIRKAERERIGLPVRVRQHVAPTQAEGLNTLGKEGERASIVVQRLWRGLFTRRILMVCASLDSRTLHHKAAIRLQQSLRGWLVRHRITKKAYRAQLDLQLQQSKDVQWSSILSWDGKDAHGRKIKVSKDKMFAGSLRTDGVSVRLFMKRIKQSEGGETGAQGTHALRYEWST